MKTQASWSRWTAKGDNPALCFNKPGGRFPTEPKLFLIQLPEWIGDDLRKRVSFSSHSQSNDNKCPVFDWIVIATIFFLSYWICSRWMQITRSNWNKTIYSETCDAKDTESSNLDTPVIPVRLWVLLSTKNTNRWITLIGQKMVFRYRLSHTIPWNMKNCIRSLDLQ